MEVEQISSRFKDNYPICGCLNCKNREIDFYGNKNNKHNRGLCVGCLGIGYSSENEFIIINNIIFIKKSFYRYDNFIPYDELLQVLNNMVFIKEEEFKI